ncbi:ribbon-helix-helix protein, CopG family [Streptomyces sp. NPDC127051]|uniref:ribbon-helix-helix protein, CopG family n=1 Tax=Streptomyces sp. NPDC127051 TaxID=3347119 RepID=UPI00365340E3
MPSGRIAQAGAQSRIGARVHDEIASGFHQLAERRGVSVTTVIREALYDYVALELDMHLEPLATTYARK